MIKKSIVSLLISTFIIGLYSCSSDGKVNHDSKETAGGIYTGGVIRLNEVESFKTLFPLSVVDQVSHHITSQLFEGLVRFDQKDLSILPAIAYKWDVNEDKTQWTFHLRKGVKFHDNPCFADGKGREVTASDFKYCFNKLCTADPQNNQFYVTFSGHVIGANETYDQSKLGKSIDVTGVNALNDSTLIINLTHPYDGFLNILATQGGYVFAKEAFEKYGQDIRINAVGSGPFQLDAIKEGEVVVLKKNPNYYGIDKNGNKLPYLDGVKYSFIREKKTEILEFKNGNLDMIYRLPVEVFHDIMGDLKNAQDRKHNFEVLSSPALITTFLGFNCTNSVFTKKEVRLAFNYAIDRKRIADFTIQGEGTAANYGMVPYFELFEKEGFNYKSILGYTLDVAKAKDYLKKAGYADGKGFPKVTLQINSGGGDRNILVAEVVQKMLKENLNIDVEVTTVPLAENIEQIQSGKIDLYRLSWYADYPEPRTFLNLFYGKHVPDDNTQKSFINVFRYKNARFDSLFEASNNETDKAKRYELLSKAENIVLEDAPFIPLYYEDNFRLEQFTVRNFPENSLNYINLTEVYLIPKDKLSKN